jgi:hypothetical protein
MCRTGACVKIFLIIIISEVESSSVRLAVCLAGWLCMALSGWLAGSVSLAVGLAVGLAGWLSG